MIMDSSYRRYKQYRANQHQYKVNQVAAPIAMMVIIGFITKYWWVLVVLIVVLLMLKYLPKYIGKLRVPEQQAVHDVRKIIEQKEKSNIQKEEMIIMRQKGNSTETGYVNKNNQKNNGKTDIPGTGFGQWFYDMECLDCGHKYHANGHDVWLRKCPKCQGGRP